MSWQCWKSVQTATPVRQIRWLHFHFHYFNILEALPVNFKQIAEASCRHPILSRVLHYIKGVEIGVARGAVAPHHNYWGDLDPSFTVFL